MWKSKALIIVGAIWLYSPFSFSYYYMQESKNNLHYWSFPYNRVELAPGEMASLPIKLEVRGDFNSYKEYVTCVSGCNDGVRYSTPFIENDPWRMGVAMTAPFTIRASGGGRSATFNINGESVGGLNYIGTGGSAGDVRSMYFTDGVAYHSSPWIGSFQTSVDATYIWHNENYGGVIKLSAPAGTPAGNYTYTGNLAQFNLQYCGTSCNPSFRSGTYWHPFNGTLNITVLSRCEFSNASMTLDYSSLSPKAANGSVKKAVTQLTCNSDVNSGKLKLISTSGSNQISTVGTSVKVRDNMDAIVTVNGKDASGGISLQGPFNNPIEVVSMLNTYGSIPGPGTFQGGAVLSFEPD
ncbi:hypothetical protein FOT43_22600 [Serratia marcescens]|uniref:MrpH family fimbial adhesin n=1 Tax=Serratia marcescens TaxID=615 RepID=UPI00117C1E68|nr:hypothetical protein [Serratia marcescens]TSB25749.1 hypothetical protein FOT43_22600 [Serratia marcescens]TXE43922.1 hypothetical protein FOT60_12590 [Serratia marcescens]